MKVKLFALWLMLATVSCTILPAQATVSTTAPRNDYIGTNATATYSYTFKIFAATDLRVTTRNTSGVETALTYPTDYTVTGAGSASGGTITLTAGNLATDYLLTIRFDRTPRQATDLRNQGSFFAETHEAKFDELTRYSQQLEDVVDRSIHLPETEAGTAAATTLPVAALRGGKFFGWDGSGNPIAAAGTSADLTPVSTFINGLLDDVDAATARTTLGAVGLTGNETIAGNKTLSGTTTISGTVTPSKACAAGFTRRSPNYCSKNTPDGSSTGALVLGNVCTGNSTLTSSVPSGARVDLEIRFTLVSMNATGARSATFQSYTDASCTGGDEDRTGSAYTYEQAATAGSVTLLQIAHPLERVVLASTSVYYKATATTGSSILFKLLGYYD